MVWNESQLTEREQIILDLLPVGHKRPIGLRELTELAHINEREIREIIYVLITIHGLPIGSSSDPFAGGYFIIEDQEDLEVATRHLKPRAKKIFRRARALEKIAQERFNQQLRLVFEE